MVWLDNTQTLESSQVNEIDRCLKKVNLHDVDDPIMLIQNTNTGKYEVGGIRDYKYEDTSAFWRDGASKWDMVKLGTLDLPFPEGKRIHIKNVHSVIITWGKEHLDWGDKQSLPLAPGLCNMAPVLEEMEELHFAIQTVDVDPTTSKKKSDILFYAGSTLLAKIENISAMRAQRQEGVYYTKKENGTFTHYIRDVNNDVYIIGKSKHTWVDCTGKRLKAIRKMAQNIVTRAEKMEPIDFITTPIPQLRELY